MLSGLGAIGLERPGAFWLLLAALPVVVLYFLRMRYRRKAVGSTYIWRALALPNSGGASLRLRSALLLALQLAAVAAAALAAAGPTLNSRRRLEPGMAFVVDVSASMATRDCPGARPGAWRSRVEAAAAAACAEIDALGDDVPLAAFACADGARPLFPAPSLDKGAVKAALRALRPGHGAFAEGAAAEGISAWLSGAGGAWRGRAFTDGGLDLGGERLAAAFGAAAGSASGAFGTVLVAGAGAGSGVAGLRLVSGPGGPAAAEFSLWNGHAGPRRLKLRISRVLGAQDGSGGAVLAVASPLAAPGWSRARVDLGAETEGGIEEGAYAIELERQGDEPEGAPGERAYLSVSARPALSVLLVGRDDPFIEAALAYGGIAYSRAASFPGGKDGDSSGAGELDSPDIAIFDGAKPPGGLRCNLLAFGAPPSDAPIYASGRASGPISSSPDQHPLSRFVSWEGSRAESALAYTLRAQAIVVASVAGKASVVAWERDGCRNLAIGIDLARSDLGLKSAFPVLLQNYLRWCAPSADEQSAYTLTVGEVARRLEPPSFRISSATVEARSSGPAVTLAPREPGIFEWSSSKGYGYLAVNAPAGEIDVAPRALRPLGPKPGAGAPVSALAAEEQESSLPFGAWAAALLAALLAVEWLAWSGRSRRRRQGDGRSA
jgi:hypothetical protein